MIPSAASLFMEVNMKYENDILVVPDIIHTDKRYMVLKLRANCDHSVALHYRFFEKGSDEVAFFIRFGILPRVLTTVLIDRNWADAKDLYPGSLPGELKVVCHGHRIKWSDVERAELSVIPSFEKTDVTVVDAYLTDEYPVNIDLEDVKLVDEFGQNKSKDWSGKVRSIEDLKSRLEGTLSSYTTNPDLTEYCGFKSKKLAEGTGYFTKYKMKDRWYLADPEGYAFFSMGPDCVNMTPDCRVDGIEKWLDYLPDRDDSEFVSMFRDTTHGRPGTLFSFLQLNFHRAWGDDYITKWASYITSELKRIGMNTLANWSDPSLISKGFMPYVYMMPEFPSTMATIFRDFPDVFSTEYE